MVDKRKKPFYTDKRINPTFDEDGERNPLKMEGAVDSPNSHWDWPKILEILADRMVENPVGGLLHAMKEPWTDPETGKTWPLPTKPAVYKAAQRRPDVAQLLRDARELHAMSLYDAVFDKILETPEFMPDSTGKGDRQNSAGVGKLRLYVDQCNRYFGAWFKQANAPQQVEITDGRSLKDVIKDGLPKLEDFKK